MRNGYVGLGEDLGCFSSYCFCSCHAKTCSERKRILLQGSDCAIPVLGKRLEQAVSTPCQNGSNVM